MIIMELLQIKSLHSDSCLHQTCKSYMDFFRWRNWISVSAVLWSIEWGPILKQRYFNWIFQIETTVFILSTGPDPGAGGVLPYITLYIHYIIQVCAAQRGREYPFQRRFQERGIIFRTRESSTSVSSHLKVFKDRLLLKIRFNALTSKPLYSCCILEQRIKNWPISRTGYQF